MAYLEPGGAHSTDKHVVRCGDERLPQLPDEVQQSPRPHRIELSENVVQQQDDPTRFVLVEAYRDAEAPARHKETQHYLTWRETVETMMAEPRHSIKFENCFPGDDAW